MLPLRLAPLYSYNFKYSIVRFCSVRKASFDLNKELSKKGFIKFKYIILNMVRTKADRVPTKAMGAKAPHKIASTTGKKSGNRGKSYSGGNPYHPRETPEWQKPITNFMNQNVTKENDVSSSSKNTENEENNTNDTSIEIDNDQN